MSNVNSLENKAILIKSGRILVTTPVGQKWRTETPANQIGGFIYYDDIIGILRMFTHKWETIPKEDYILICNPIPLYDLKVSNLYYDYVQKNYN
jgi:hypothetical protein